MPAFIDRSGTKIGRLTVIKLVKIDNKKYWECKCDCNGKIISIPKDSLSRSKTTLSCGCIQKEAAIKTGHNNTFKAGFGNSKHGLYKHPLYRCHQAMIYRCYHQDSQSYEHYGGRGIKVCKRWKGLNGLKNFIEDMYGTFQKGFELDRKNNNGNYEPNNCRWATNKEQLNNTRFNRTLLINGKRLTIAEASLLYNIKATTILSRINRNWTHNKAVLTPPTDKFKKKKDKKWQHYHINPLRNAAKMLILFTLGVKKQSLTV